MEAGDQVIIVKGAVGVKGKIKYKLPIPFAEDRYSSIFAIETKEYGILHEFEYNLAKD